MQWTCKSCGKVGGEDDFYGSSHSRCKRCVLAVNRSRYIKRYRQDRLAQFREKDLARKSIPLDASSTDLAYAAGLLDGEGCIGIRRRGRRGGKGFRIGQRTLAVEVTNTDEGMVRWLHNLFGGSVSYSPASYSLNRKAKWHWHCQANMALRCLDATFPYLKTKWRQAKLARRFQRYVQVVGRKSSPRLQALQDRFCDAISVLNKRGLR